MSGKIEAFKTEVEAAFAQPLTLNVYDNEFYSKVDGSLDFGRTSSCFQVKLLWIINYILSTFFSRFLMRKMWLIWRKSTSCLIMLRTGN